LLNHFPAGNGQGDEMDQNKPFDDQRKQGGQNPNDPNRQGGSQHQGGSQPPGQGGQHPQGCERQGGEKQGGQNR
jgi:hypothetical protein